MSSYRELLARKAELETKIEAARQLEVAEVIAQVRQAVQEFGLTAVDIGLAPRKGNKATSKGALPPMYRDPKSGATWSGRGRAPAWLGKNRDRYLIA
ncbi:DNA-binding protein (plasmid) [Ralstonia solanacearum]|nr:DNA-binding protein [Ralstonia solanacearum]